MMFVLSIGPVLIVVPVRYRYSVENGSFLFRHIQSVWWQKTANLAQPTAVVRAIARPAMRA
jgi:hypothetical protein